MTHIYNESQSRGSWCYVVIEVSYDDNASVVVSSLL